MDIGENEWLDDIRRQTKRLTKLTNDLIYLSRMEEGTDIKELSSFSISNVCQEEADSFSAVAMKRDLEITTEIEDNIDINGSEEDVRRLLSILFDNAIKYAKENSAIKIKTVKHGRYVTVTISNVAENMTEEQTKRMFDRFYRADSSRATSGGFGIGLAMAQAIVVSHNGKIYAELDEHKTLSISASFPTQYGSFRLITNFVEKQPKNANNSSQNKEILQTPKTNKQNKKSEIDEENQGATFLREADLGHQEKTAADVDAAEFGAEDEENPPSAEGFTDEENAIAAEENSPLSMPRESSKEDDEV